jgi:ribonuclease HI
MIDMASANTARLILHTDGAARGNPGPAGAGGEIRNDDGKLLAEVFEYLGEATNNVAEYKALILTLERALLFNPQEIEVRADSELLVKQLRGEYKVKNEGLKPLYAHIKVLSANLKKFEVRHVYRSENAHADELANMAIDAYQSGGDGSGGEQGSDPGTERAADQGGFEQESLF